MVREPAFDAAAQEEVESLRTLDPGFDAERLARTVPYEQDRDRDALLDALRAAGL